MAIVTQETNVGMLAMPMYYRKNIMSGTQCLEHPALTGNGGLTGAKD